MSMRTVREASDDRCPPAASPRSSLQTPHDRCRVRPAAVARNLRINNESTNDPCSAQSWTLGHLRNRWGWDWSSGTWYPRPQPACTNEATPYGESPEATRPDTGGHTARHRNAGQDQHSIASLVPTDARQITDTLAQPHARAPRALAHTKGKGHTALTENTRLLFEPGSVRTPRIQTPLVDSHAPSGWLVNRASGLRAWTW